MSVATDIYHRPVGAGRLPTAPILLLLIGAAVLLAVAAREGVPTPVAVEVEYTTHAEKHPEAHSIRRCLEQRGADSVWRSRSWREPFKFFRTCLLPDGTIGMQIVKWSWRSLAWREVTSFVIKDGRAAQVREYLTAVAVKVH